MLTYNFIQRPWEALEVTERSVRSAAHVYRQAQLRIGLRLADFEAARTRVGSEDRRALREAGCTHVGQLGEEVGIASSEARGLAALGWCVRRDARVGAAWREGRLNLVSVRALRTVLEAIERMTPERRAESIGAHGDVDWVVMAVTCVTSAFRDLVDHMVFSWKTNTKPVRLSLWVTPEGLQWFRRARLLAMARLKKPLSEGETLEILSKEYVDAWDPLAEPVGRRRLPHTADVLDSRTIPAIVKRMVIHRDNATCRVPGCGRRIRLHFSHVEGHLEGGDREIANILLLCDDHNLLQSNGYLIIKGDANNPIFLCRDGRVHIPFLWHWQKGPTVEEWLAIEDKVHYYARLGLTYTPPRPTDGLTPPSPTDKAPTEAVPTEEVSIETAPVQKKPTETSPPTEAAPATETAPVTEALPTEDVAPAQDIAPAPKVAPAQDVGSLEDDWDPNEIAWPLGVSRVDDLPRCEQVIREMRAVRPDDDSPAADPERNVRAWFAGFEGPAP